MLESVEELLSGANDGRWTSVSHAVATTVTRTPHELDWIALTTAGATVALVLVTAALVLYTWRLAAATNSPSVVVTIEPNRSSLMHFDLHAANEGTSAAFDIEMKFEPELPPWKEDGPPTPLKRISVLRSGESISSALSSYAKLHGRAFAVTVSWRNRPHGRRSASRYTIDMNDYDGYRQLGSDSLAKIASELRDIRSDWRSIANGQRALEVDTFNAADREMREAERQEWLEKVGAELEAHNVQEAARRGGAPAQAEAPVEAPPATVAAEPATVASPVSPPPA